MCHVDIIKFTNKLSFSLYSDDRVGTVAIEHRPHFAIFKSNFHMQICSYSPTSQHHFLASLMLRYPAAPFCLPLNNTTCCDDLCKQHLCYIRWHGPIIASPLPRVSVATHCHCRLAWDGQRPDPPRNTGAVLPQQLNWIIGSRKQWCHVPNIIISISKSSFKKKPSKSSWNLVKWKYSHS